ncbi:MAG: hypothetical protein R2867_04110 [Caldilineaceae bacterium]
MANLATEIGHLHISTDYAQKSLTLYAETGDLLGQFRAQLRMARNFIQQGHYGEAQSRLRLARDYFYIGTLGIATEIQLLNAEIHLRWYQGKINDALQPAQLYLKLADRAQLRNARLYARILLGNLYRDRGDFQLAAQWYDETQSVINEYNHRPYQPWLDAQRAWLLILQGEIDQALSHITSALATTDHGQKMSFQVSRAVLYLLQREPEQAELLLQESLHFYEQSGDPMAACAIRIYLANAAWQRGNTAVLVRQLQTIFQWLEQHNIDALPYWWHPQIVTDVCVQALIANIAPCIVDQMIVRRLKHQSIHALARYLDADDLDIRQRVNQLLTKVTGENEMLLAHLEESPAKQVLQELLESGKLQAEHYLRLEVELMTAKQRRRPNPTLVAVFALHIHGIKRRTIAERLECSTENVRNYITAIYQHFDLPAKAFHNRAARRQQLAKLARENGLSNWSNHARRRMVTIETSLRRRAIVQFAQWPFGAIRLH